MTPRVLIYVNGIKNRPGDSRNWNGRAVTWTHLNTPHHAEKLEYYCSALGRRFWQKERDEKLAKMISFYADAKWEIVLAGHSNGCDVILGALGLLDWPRIERLHLVAGACEKDFEVNRLNDALNGNKIGNVTVYVAGKDSAMRVARLWLSRLLGYGDLGLNGPVNADAALVAAGRIQTVRWPDLDHSDCWKDYRFDDTMKLLTT